MEQSTLEPWVFDRRGRREQRSNRARPHVPLNSLPTHCLWGDWALLPYILAQTLLCDHLPEKPLNVTVSHSQAGLLNLSHDSARASLTI